MYLVTDIDTLRASPGCQCKARSAGNGQSFPRIATPKWQPGGAPEGRARKRPSAALCLLERTGPFPARQALRLTTSWLAECVNIGDEVH